MPKATNKAATVNKGNYMANAVRVEERERTKKTYLVSTGISSLQKRRVSRRNKASWAASTLEKIRQTSNKMEKKMQVTGDNQGSNINRTYTGKGWGEDVTDVISPVQKQVIRRTLSPLCFTQSRGTLASFFLNSVTSDFLEGCKTF